MPSVRTTVELGAVIRDARERRNWTQSELAQRAKVTRQWLIRMEQGRHDRAQIGLVLAVLNVLGVQLNIYGSPGPGDSLPGRYDDAPVDLDAVIDAATGG